MGWRPKSSKECEDTGGHDQRGPHTRTNDKTGEKSKVVECRDCGSEWSYDRKGRRNG